jgi:drug/metabolite transporter (DMT)-like permease
VLLKWTLVGIIVAATTAGYLFQALGMREHGELHEFNPSALGRTFSALARNGWVILSVIAMAISFFSFMALVSIADLSFAVPATACSLVFETVLARIVLKESVDWKRWAGAGLVACGVALLA